MLTLVGFSGPSFEVFIYNSFITLLICCCALLFVVALYI